jgi:hypothetical protein
MPSLGDSPEDVLTKVNQYLDYWGGQMHCGFDIYGMNLLSGFVLFVGMFMLCHSTCRCSGYSMTQVSRNRCVAAAQLLFSSLRRVEAYRGIYETIIAGQISLRRATSRRAHIG